MNNVTTFETAQRLKAAGFPQPVPEFGQVWYAQKGDICFCTAQINFYNGPGFAFLKKETESTFDCQADYPKKNMAFAPTATDILRELGFDYFIVYEEQYAKGFQCCFDMQSYDHENPAEAAALAYLSLHEKTEKNEL